MGQHVSRRALAARRNGSIGGLKTAQTQTPEFLEQRASKAGSSTRDRYGIGYYSYLAKASRKVLKSIRKPSREHRQQLVNSILPNNDKSTTSVDLMHAATATLEA